MLLTQKETSAARGPTDLFCNPRYLFGGAETAWGAVRIRDGHPEPYGSVWFQFGNEGTSKANLSSSIEDLADHALMSFVQ